MGSTFDPTRCAVVDRAGQCVVLRGSMPLTPSGDLAYDGIASASGLDLRARRLLVISLIDNTGERAMWEREQAAFGLDPGRLPQTYWPPYLNAPAWAPRRFEGALGGGRDGALCWWPIEGFPDGEDPKVYLTSPGWDLGGLVDWLIETVRAAAAPTAIYFHCSLGADRTGALHSGYLMRGKGMSLADASNVVDTATSAKAPNQHYKNLRSAYARMIGK